VLSTNEKLVHHHRIARYRPIERPILWSRNRSPVIAHHPLDKEPLLVWTGDLSWLSLVFPHAIYGYFSLYDIDRSSFQCQPDNAKCFANVFPVSISLGAPEVNPLNLQLLEARTWLVPELKMK
jgi:hypothetical protein